MSHRVSLLQDAEDDLLDVYEFVLRSGTAREARDFLNQLKRTCRSLAKLPQRGHFPAELERVGITLYREIHHGTLRIIYEIVLDEVHIHAILDSRRNVQELLERRMLR